jgi:hypothetical protein
VSPEQEASGLGGQEARHSPDLLMRGFDRSCFCSYKSNTGYCPSELSKVAQGEEHMKTSRGQQRPAFVRPAVEQLEARQLLSVSVLPHNINLHGAEHGNGVFTVKVLGDTQAGKDLVSASSLTFTVGGVTLTPIRQHSFDHNSGLILKFRRSDLATLMSGPQTLTVAGAGTTSTETATFNLFEPGNGNNGHGHHGHHGNHGNHGHGHND